MKKQLTNGVKFLFFLSLGVLLVWLAIKDKTDEELHNIRQAVQQSNYFWIILSIFISGLSHFFRAIRWKIVLKPIGHNPKTSNAFFSVMIGYLANLALPRVGEVTRCGLLAQYEKVPFVQGFGTVIAERALDVICVILLFFLTLGIEFDKISGIANDMIYTPLSAKLSGLAEKQGILIILGICFIIFAAALFYFRKKIQSLLSSKVKGFIGGLWEGLMSIKNVDRPILYIVYTILIWLMYILQVYVCFFAFDELIHLPFVAAMVITVFGGLAVAVVPGGTGVYQLIVIEILTSVYFTSDTASFAFAWSVWASQIILILFLGLASLVLLPMLNKNKEVKA